MNALIREQYEAPVLTNESIEVHLTYLRTGFDAVQGAVLVLRDKIDRLSATVDAKIEKTHERIDAVNTSLNAKIDRLDAKVDQLGARLDARIDKLDGKVSKLTDDLSEVRGYQKALFWVISIVGTIIAATSLARAFHWV